MLIGVVVWMCVRAHAEPLIWPSLGVVVSAHFAPLGRIFHVRTYYFTAIAGTLVSVLGFAVSATPSGVASFGVAMAAVMWVSALHVLVSADRIADHACAEQWAS